MVITFACFGITIEVIFTAITSVINHEPLCGKPLVALAGYTYMWMLPIYAIIPVLAIAFYDKVKHIPIYLRLPLYVLIIYAIEFSSGWLLCNFTGYCPWNYTEGWHVMGFIRLDYFPAWLGFAWLVERLYLFMDSAWVK